MDILLETLGGLVWLLIGVLGVVAFSSAAREGAGLYGDPSPPPKPQRVLVLDPAEARVHEGLAHRLGRDCAGSTGHRRAATHRGRPRRRIETACRIQIDALAGGSELQPISAATQCKSIEQGRRMYGPGGFIEAGREWPALLRQLERVDGTSYRQ